MKILFIGKFPPIQGGVSASSLIFVRDLAKLGHEVHVLTNANDVELGFRQNLVSEDWTVIEKFVGDNVIIHDFSANTNLMHIPFNKLYAERLFGFGVKLIESENFDLIFGWYFQPYGLVASQLGRFFNIPYYLNHAGSDLGRLSKDESLRYSYKWMIDGAERIYTRRTSIDLLIETFPDIEKDKIEVIKKGSRLPRHFSFKASELDLEDLRIKSQQHYKNHYYNGLNKQLERINSNPIDKSKPIIAMYGKLGHSKGSYAAIKMLNKLNKNGVDFQFIYITGGTKTSFSEFVSFIGQFPQLQTHVWILPFISYLKIPSFLKSCDILMFLENNFSIEIHNPSIPFEILSSGKCLITTKEITDKTILKHLLVEGKNYVSVDEPDNTDEFLTKVETLLKQKTFNVIGAHGRAVHYDLQNQKSELHPLAEIINEKTNANNVYSA